MSARPVLHCAGRLQHPALRGAGWRYCEEEEEEENARLTCCHLLLTVLNRFLLPVHYAHAL